VERRDVKVRIAVAAVLLAAIAGCSAAGTPVANVSTGQVNATHPATQAASRPATSNPAASKTSEKPTPTPARPSALQVAPASAAALPQTSALPKTTNAAFGNAVHDIWLAVTTGDPNYALPAFFPVKAYEQVKAIADPESDWDDRLWYDFTLDIAAVHKLIKPGATLTKVVVPTQYAQWIPVGACYNSLGYWHVPGSRVVYRQDGTTYSFGIASFISWRGVWYLVHLGALSRGGAYGIVDDPELGEGVPGPPGGC
jgi:hypothetical protein